MTRELRASQMPNAPEEEAILAAHPGGDLASPSFGRLDWKMRWPLEGFFGG